MTNTSPLYIFFIKFCICKSLVTIFYFFSEMGGHMYGQTDSLRRIFVMLKSSQVAKTQYTLTRALTWCQWTWFFSHISNRILLTMKTCVELFFKKGHFFKR